jgi:hypothetical protein
VAGDGDGRPEQGGRSNAHGQGAAPIITTPEEHHHQAALDLIELVTARHSAGRPAGLGFFDPSDVAALLMATLDIAALACREVDRLRPAGSVPFLDILRRVGPKGATAHDPVP